MARRPPDLRLGAAVAAARLTSAALRRTGRGGGTAAPGLVADVIDPRLLTKVAGRLPRGVVVVAGTNGKTTTSRMVADILEADGRRVVHNRSGSNLVRGVAAAFADQTTPLGRPLGDTGVVEADEAALPEILERVRPRVVLLTNLFRDQLDRYGELNTVATRWEGALARLPAAATVVVNADDPSLAELTRGIAARRVTFGIAGSTHTLDRLPHAADSATCRRCGADLRYAALYLSHLGDWACPRCTARRPDLDVAARDIRLDGVERLALTVDRNGVPEPYEAGVPGLYNAYNVLAAVAACREMGVPAEVAARAMAAFRSAFGRIERVDVRGRRLTLALVKNPVGFNEVLRMLTAPADGAAPGLSTPTLIAINDRYADGRDVSWLWDVDVELLAEGDAPLATAGIRGDDMANRLKYAGVPADRILPLGADLPAALDRFVDRLPEGGTAYVLPTYTAMLDLRAHLARTGSVDTFWKQ